MKILALDLGKSKTVACDFAKETGAHTFHHVLSTPGDISALLVRRKPDLVVFEVCTDAGWVADACRDLGAEFQAVNPSSLVHAMHARRAKSDRKDALDLARLAAMGSGREVHIPERDVRVWRETIEQRASAVGARTARRNRVRSMLQSLAAPAPAGDAAWTAKGMLAMRERCAALPGETDRERMRIHLDGLDASGREVAELEALLDRIAAAHPEVRLLQTVPGVGPRCAEAVVAWLDDAERFGNARQVGCYSGMTPRQNQSGQTDRSGRISNAGPTRLRSLLVEVSWVALRHNPWAREVYERVRRGSPSRKKQAIVAVARRLLVRLWAMMRDGTPWSPPAPRQAKAARA